MKCWATRATRRKEMNTTIRGHNLRAKVVMPLLAVLLLLAVVFAGWPAVTTSDRDISRAIQAMSAEGIRGSSLTDDPIHRHVEVVEHLGNGSLR
jgi:hypothetical protein